MNVISVRGLSVVYQATAVFSDVSFDVREGDYVGVVGPNGAGKTTLVKAVLGLIEPAAGDISIFGSAPSEFSRRKEIGYLPQKPLTLNPLFPASVREIVASGLLAGKRFPKRFDRRDEKAVDRALDEMGILPIKDALVGELSGGQQQRVLAARAIVNEPRLLVLDEPVTALDPSVSAKFMETIRRLNEDRRVTVILVTHDLADIGRYASKLLYIDRKLVYYGTFGEVCRSKTVGAYFGTYLQHLMCHQHDKERR